MPPPCSLVRHPEAADIALACINGDSSRDIAARFGTSKSAVDRYRKHVNLSSAAAAAVAAAPVEPIKPVPVEPVPLGDARDVQLDVQRRLLLQFSHCERRNDSRGCALIAVQIRLNAEWLRADAEEAPGAAPPVAISFSFSKSAASYASGEVATMPVPELQVPVEGAEIDARASAMPEIVVTPETETEEAKLVRLGFEKLARQRAQDDAEDAQTRSALIEPHPEPRRWGF